jgi:serine/threonine protein kinase
LDGRDAESGSRAVADDDCDRTASVASTTSPLDAEPSVDWRVRTRERARYEVVRVEGHGGIGRVFRATDRDLNRPIAIKELKARSTEAEVRFLREALVTARLEHPGIVPIHDAGRWEDGTPFYAMKLVDGRPLSELLDACSSVDERSRYISNVIAVCDAIAYAHSRGIVHRDLKPSNIMVGTFGETVVVDWGLARTADERAAAAPDAAHNEPLFPTVTRTGAVVGTPAYMAPEQAAGEPIDERADVYALGQILWDVLAGYGQRERHKRSRRRWRDLEAIAACATSRRRDDRYASVRALGEDLRRFASREPIAARRYGVFERVSLLAARHAGFALVGTAAIIAIAVLATVAALRLEAQRVRTIRAEMTARAGWGAAEQARSALVLEQAELLLRSDPTRALALVSRYAGGERQRAAFVEAEATALGTAVAIVTAHTDKPRSLRPIDDALFSIGNDGRVMRTDLAGRSSIVTTLPSSSSAAVIGRTHIAVADRDRIALVSPDGARCNETTVGAAVTDLVFSPGGSTLGATLADDSFVWFRVTRACGLQQLHRSQVDGHPLVFVHEDAAIIFTVSKTVVVRESGPALVLDMERPSVWSRGTRFDALIGADGTGTLFDVATGTMRRIPGPCRGAAADVALNELTARVVIGCDDGQVYDWSFDGRSRLLVDFGTPIAGLYASAEGRWLAVMSEVPVVFDRLSGSLSSHVGHASRPNTLSLPTREFPYFASADPSGTVRIWRPTPQRGHRVRVASTKIFHANLLDDTALLADGTDGRIR